MRCNLPYCDVPPDACRSGAFVNTLLQEAGKRTPTNGSLLIAVDALDEVNRAGHPLETNVLFLPPSLPTGVHIVVTSRPDDIPLQATERVPLDLEAGGEANLADARKFIESQLSHPEVDAWRTKKRLSEEKFVAEILGKSAGNFMYLHYVLAAIAGGEFKDYSLENLPDGLKEYYRGHWRAMRGVDPAAFEQMHQQIICRLAAADRPVTVEKLVEWTKLAAPKVLEVLQEWRQFLTVELNKEKDKTYRLYHATFKEFLEEEAGLSQYSFEIASVALRKAGKMK